MKKIILIAILAFGSNFATAQDVQDTLSQKAVQRIKEKFPVTRIFNFEYNQSLDRRFSSKLDGQDFQERDIRSQRNFMASANIPVYKTQKWSFTASLFYQFSEFEFENIENSSVMPLFERNGTGSYHNFSTALSATYFSVLFNKPIILKKTLNLIFFCNILTLRSSYKFILKILN